MHVSLTAAGGVDDFDGARRTLIAQAFAAESGVAEGAIEVLVEAGYGVAADGEGVVTLTVYLRTESADAARAAMNVLGSDLASPQAATQLLAAASVEVVSVQLVEQKTPAELGAALGGGGAEGERDGWRGGTIAAVVLLLLGAVGIGVYCLCFRKRGAAKTPGAAAQLTISTNASVPPPAQVGLPAGWTAAADPKSGQTYYISPKGEPTWTLPGAV